MPDSFEIKIDNKEVEKALLEVSSKAQNLKLLMKNIAGIMASSTEDNFNNEGRPEKWKDLTLSTKKQRKKTGHYPGKILQVEGMLALSITTQYDNESAVIGSNLEYARIHQLGGQSGRNLATTIPARPYLKLTNEDYEEILESIINFLD